MKQSKPSEAQIICVAKERMPNILAADPHREHGLGLAIFNNLRRRHGGGRVGVVLQNPPTARLARRFFQQFFSRITASLDEQKFCRALSGMA